MISHQQSVFKRHHSDKHFSEFYLQDGGKKSTGIDMERLLRHCQPLYCERSHRVWTRLRRTEVSRPNWSSVYFIRVLWTDLQVAEDDIGLSFAVAGR